MIIVSIVLFLMIVFIFIICYFKRKKLNQIKDSENKNRQTVMKISSLSEFNNETIQINHTHAFSNDSNNHHSNTINIASIQV